MTARPCSGKQPLTGDETGCRQRWAAKARGGKVKAKYRDPKTKETWSGRGRMASWLKAKQDAGGSRGSSTTIFLAIA
jgi:DNA-binding protein H-NS